MKTLLLATNNTHKVREFQAIFRRWTLESPQSVGLAHWNHEETADTFMGNALGKAQSLWNATQGRYPVIADDSGLCVDALEGAPGVYSARYGQAAAGRPLTDTEKNHLVLDQMSGREDRSARFVCALALVAGPHRQYVVEEAWEGQIALGLNGAHGFGYDPLFYLPELGMTSAALEPERKNRLSHRARASRLLVALLRELDRPEEDL